MLSVEDAERELTNYHRVVTDRDNMVRRARAAGISKNRIHTLTGIARTTIDRIPLEAPVTYTAEIGISPLTSLTGMCGVTITPDQPTPGEGLDNVDTTISAAQAADMERGEVIEAAETVLAAHGWTVCGEWVDGDNSYYATVTSA